MSWISLKTVANYFNGTSSSRKLLLAACFSALYCILNYLLHIPLPGFTEIDLRPQIVLLFIAGYLFGPGFGFAIGFVGNVCTDLVLGYGLHYLFSWSVGNGLIGGLFGFFPHRAKPRLNRVGQLFQLVLWVALVNVLSLVYASGMESLLNPEINQLVNYRYFFFPAVMSNTLAAFILLPPALLLLRRLQWNFPIKLTLANYYGATTMLILFWLAVIHPGHNFSPFLGSSNDALSDGNVQAMLDAFNRWSFLFVLLLGASFLLSAWMSGAIVKPLKLLERTVFDVMKGEPNTNERLDRLVQRQDEVGLLSYAIRLLSERLWESQELFRREMEKHMPHIDPGDSGSDIFIVSILSLHGPDAFTESGIDILEQGKTEISVMDAVSLAIVACGLKELAETYSASKVEQSLSGTGVDPHDSAWSPEQWRKLALAVDVNLLFPGKLKVVRLEDHLDRDLAFHLLERGQAFRNNDAKHIGYLTEPDIVGKICERWESAPKIRCDELEAIINKAISQEIIVGCQIKTLDQLARFDPGMALSYSHSDMKHIKQLLGLMKSENLQAKTQLESKRSSFQYRPEWKLTDDLHLETLTDGCLIAHKDEFDLVLEFTTEAYRAAFRFVVEEHAKRDADGERKLLFDSWFLPLYRADRPAEGYVRIAAVTIQDGKHIAQAYVREEDAEAKAEWFRRECPTLEVSTPGLWVNEAFLRYLNGGSV